VNQAARRRQTIIYLLGDALSAGIAWTLFFAYRKRVIESSVYGVKLPIKFDQYFYTGLAVIVTFWLLFYTMGGRYKDIFRKSRLKDFTSTAVYSILGTLIIFFALILDDTIVNYRTYYSSFFTLLSLHFGINFLFRFAITTQVVRKVHSKKISFPSIMVGGGFKALELYKELEHEKKSSGNRFVGFVQVYDNEQFELESELKKLGSYKDLSQLIGEYEIEEVLIAIESSEHDRLEQIISELEDTDVMIKILPDTYDIITGSVRLQSIFGTPLIEVKHDLMQAWEFNLKRIFDILVSASALILLFPLLLFTAVMVKMSSKGPIFYKQYRIGKYGKSFKIVKFRSMYVDAEKHGPQLSSTTDSRITPWGKVMRKFRLDELPQFYNVLIGEMSIVGPRPERQFYIDQIKSKAPHYRYLQKVRPGITSWGMVKYGYAENVDQMIERMKYDILYIENMSLFIDLKILIYTVLIVVQGRGK
jgi:exopolysaccharide biosynthesis polyprenyl glycosylphosphotransferase